jgi:class 3 adenylate cyclase
MYNSALAPQPSLSPSANLSARLATVREMSGLDPQILDEFAAFVMGAPDEQLFRTNPYRFAEMTGISERRAVDLFLYATHAGIFEFSWGVLCPGCASFITSPGGLRTLETHGLCTMCRREIDIIIDDNVEVAFTVSPSVRRIRFHSQDTIEVERDWKVMYFSTSRIFNPGVTDFLERIAITFERLDDGGTRSIDLDLEPGAYLVSAPRYHANTLFLTSPGGMTDVTFDLLDGRILPENVVVAPGKVHITIRNRTGQPVVYGVIHDPRESFLSLPEVTMGMTRPWAMLPFLTGKQIATSQVFRDLFRTESIPSDLGLAFKSVTFLFSDLKGSTALYERIGDVRAYQLVREHFGLLREIITELGGAVVKTMGDAVMASFAEPVQALEAAMLMNREITKLGADEALVLKVGIHTGSCVAVESNSHLDYFGQAVNMAARVQNLAGAGDIVITEAVYDSPGASEAIRSAGMIAAGECTVLRGMERETTCYRLS